MVLLLNISTPCPAPPPSFLRFFNLRGRSPGSVEATLHPAPSTLLPPLRSVLGEYLILATNPAFLWLLPVSAKHVNSSVTPETSPAALSASQTTAPTHVSLSVGIPTPLPSLFLILPPLQTCLCHHCESRLDFM